MGSNNNMNFGKSFGNEAAAGDGGAGGSGRPPGSGLGSGNFGLARQLSVYSLTFDEFQNTLGGMGKDFGSMNMDELLKNIWSAEETQCMTTGAAAAGAGAGAAATASAAAAAAAAAAVGSSGQDGGNSGGYLQRQGSLTLPRTLSQKTVDEVWKDIAKELNGGKDGGGGSNVAQNQRQQTLGEITLEEFLVRAGVVREDTEVLAKPNNTNAAAVAAAGMFADFSRSNNNNNNNNGNTGFGINFQQPGRGVELMGNRLADNNHQMALQSANLPLNVNGVRTSQQQPTPTQLSQQSQQQQQQQQQHLQQQQPLFPKQPAVSYASAMTLSNNTQLGNTGLRGGIVGLGDPGMNNNLVPSAAQQGGAGMSMVGLGGGGAIGVPAGSPALSSDGIGRSNGDSSSVSPVPYMFNGGGLRGRKGIHAVDKVVERRQRRMIKNRESAARSRARKQAYTMELEQEVEKLKEENLELRKKQAEIMEQQKNQVMEMMNNAQTGSRKKLRRTQTGPW